MYSGPPDSASSRVLPAYRPLVYQWALHLLSALGFVHSHDVVFGDLGSRHCWLSSSPSLSLSLVGFVNAGFRRYDGGGGLYEGDYAGGEPFHPLSLVRGPRCVPTAQMDLFMWGCLVYELMTGLWPGNGLGQSMGDVRQMVPRREWPPLEKKCMGEVVRRCWEGVYQSAEDIKRDVIAFLEADGWEINGEDDLGGFDAASMFQER
jgi:hypothetical protein